LQKPDSKDHWQVWVSGTVLHSTFAYDERAVNLMAKVGPPP
jgi:hypothetical protein